MLGPNAGHCHVRDGSANFRRQLARRPVRRPVGRLVLGSLGQHLRFNPLNHFMAFAAAVTGGQPGQSIPFEAFIPATDLAIAAVQLRANAGPG